MSRIYKNSGVPVSTFSTDGKIHCVANHSKSEYTWIKSINGIQIQSEKTTTHTTPFRSENTGYSDLANELANRTFNPSIASKSALETEILSRFSTASFLKNKKLDLYIIDHGGTNTAGENYYSSTFGNSRISGSDIGEKISKTNEGTFRVILDNCYSGKGIENILSKIMNKMQKTKISLYAEFRPPEKVKHHQAPGFPSSTTIFPKPNIQADVRQVFSICIRKQPKTCNIPLSRN